MIIGSFHTNEDDDNFFGEILTLNFAVRAVSIIPNPGKGEGAPDYRVIAPTEIRNVDLGAAWKRKDSKGREYLSVSLDAPFLKAPFTAALFPNNDGTASLVWNRQKPHAKAGAATKAA